LKIILTFNLGARKEIEETGVELDGKELNNH
jgi:hypothetical protein